MGDAIDAVIGESARQIAEAQTELDRIPPHRIDNIVSNHVATILLRRLANFVEKRANDGFLTKKEARLYLNKIDHNIRNAQDGRTDESLRQCVTNGLDEDAESPAPSTEESNWFEAFFYWKLEKMKVLDTIR